MRTLTSVFTATLVAFSFCTGKDYSAQEIADLFYQLNHTKIKPHAKINHSKGFCAKGVFEPVANATKIVNSEFLKQKSIPIEVRYSLGGALDNDNSKGRGMAIKMQGDTESWTMVMLNAEINFAKNAEEFGQFLEMRVPKDGKVDEAQIKKLTQEIDSFRNYEKYLQTIGITKNVAYTPFFSTHTFHFKDSKGNYFPARWRLEPTKVEYANKQELETIGKDFLLENFKDSIKKAPIVYKMYLTYPNKNDRIDDTTALWKGKHKEVLLGNFKVDSLSDYECNFEVFFPSDLPSGISEPKDPLFQIRNEVYGITFGFRN